MLFFIFQVWDRFGQPWAWTVCYQTPGHSSEDVGRQSQWTELRGQLPHETETTRNFPTVQGELKYECLRLTLTESFF